MISSLAQVLATAQTDLLSQPLAPATLFKRFENAAIVGQHWWDRHNDDEDEVDEPEPVPEPEPTPEPVPEPEPVVEPEEDDDSGYEYHPYDDFVYSIHHCDAMCQIIYTVHLINIGVHLETMIERLHGWANGNLILLANTAFLLFLSTWNMGLVIEYPELLALHSDWRTVPFTVAALFLTAWYSAFMSLFIRYRDGDKLTDSISDVVFTYCVWITTPTAIVSSIYAILLGIKTEDLHPEAFVDNTETLLRKVFKF